MLKGGLVLIWELDMNLVPTPVATLRMMPRPIFLLKGGLVLIWELDMNLVPTLIYIYTFRSQ